MFRVVLADTNVLFGRTVRDYLLYSHEARLIRICWSRTILDELEKRLTSRFEGKNPDAPAVARRLIATMERYFPDSEVEVTQSDLTRFADLDLPDRNDIPVLAAAYAAQADIICTDNLSDFPAAAIERAAIDGVMSADQALLALMQHHPNEMAEVHRMVVLKNPRLGERQTIEKLEAAQCLEAAKGVQEITRPGGSHWVREHNRKNGHWRGYWRRNPSR